MNRFTSPTVVEIDHQRGQVILQRDFVYCVGAADSKARIVVPAGFRCDMTSIPRLFRPFWGQLGMHNKAGILHDFLYSRKYVYTGRDYMSFNRAQADAVFYEALRVAGVGAISAKLMYYTVRCFGGVRYQPK